MSTPTPDDTETRRAEVLARQVAAEGRLEGWARILRQDRGHLRDDYHDDDEAFLQDLRLAL